MKKIFSLILVTFLSIAVAYEPFHQDKDLVKLLQEKQIRLFIMRHGQTLNNRLNIVSSSPSLLYYTTTIGFLQTFLACYQLKDNGIDTVYSGPLYRTIETAHVLRSLLGVEKDLIVDSRINQPFFGELEEIFFDYYQKYFRSADEMFKLGAPAGEPGIDVQERVRSFLWDLAYSNSKNILVVTHAFLVCYINNCLTGKFGKLPVEGEFVVYDFTQNN